MALKHKVYPIICMFADMNTLIWKKEDDRKETLLTIIINISSNI